MDWEPLKGEIRKMYSGSDNPMEQRRKMEKRRWRKGEKFSQYYNDKVLLGNIAGVPDSEMIHYVIDGYDDKVLKSQCRMMLGNINTLEDLFQIMNNVIREEPAAFVPRNHSYHTPGTSTSRDQHREQRVTPSKPVLRCFNCRRDGHRIADCDKPKKERESCFECGSRDHQLRECPRRERNVHLHVVTYNIHEIATKMNC